MKEKKIFYFRTVRGIVCDVVAVSFEQAEEIAAKKYNIVEYLGWTRYKDRQ